MTYRGELEVKIIDSFFLNNGKSGFLRKFNEGDYYCCLSPQAMGGLLIGPDGLRSFDERKNDIWAVGMCIMAALINEPYNMFYDWGKLQIHYS
jgi:hypothetical protein